ncbi:MAG TPA: hypothetical protein VNL77_22430 [Roseiflexaceae bacterium]|nr:hypothetical protein [Roseiflexaceae bacterium]
MQINRDHHQVLIYGCLDPLGGPNAAVDRLATAAPGGFEPAEWLWEQIGAFADGRRWGDGQIVLDWPADSAIVAPLGAEERLGDQVFGVVVAATDGHHAHQVRGTFVPHLTLQDETWEPFEHLAHLALAHRDTIAQAMVNWEVVRFAFRAHGMDLPAGRLFLVELP